MRDYVFDFLRFWALYRHYLDPRDETELAQEFLALIKVCIPAETFFQLPKLHPLSAAVVTLSIRFENAGVSTVSFIIDFLELDSWLRQVVRMPGVDRNG